MDTRLPHPDSLRTVVDRILASRQITRIDQHLLLAAGQLSQDEQTLINVIFDRLRRGLLKVAD